MLEQVNSFVNYLKYEKRYSNHTIVSYSNDLSGFVNYCENVIDVHSFTNVKHNQIRSWLVHLYQQDMVAKTINRKISAIRSLYKYLLRENIVTENPTRKILAPKIPKRLPSFIDHQSLDQLIGTLDNFTDYITTRDRMIVELLYSTGMRRAELISIKDSRFDFSQHTLKVLGKGNKERLIPFGKKLRTRLKKYIEIRNIEFDEMDDFFFLTKKGKKMYPKLVYNIVKKLLSSVSTSEKRSPHVLRHSFATQLTNNGAEINAIKELLGHSNLAATQIYTHNSIQKLKDAYKSAHPKAN